MALGIIALGDHPADARQMQQFRDVGRDFERDLTTLGCDQRGVACEKYGIGELQVAADQDSFAVRRATIPVGRRRGAGRVVQLPFVVGPSTGKVRLPQQQRAAKPVGVLIVGLQEQALFVAGLGLDEPPLPFKTLTEVQQNVDVVAGQGGARLERTLCFAEPVQLLVDRAQVEQCRHVARIDGQGFLIAMIAAGRSPCSCSTIPKPF